MSNDNNTNVFEVSNNVILKDNFDKIVSTVINDISNSVSHTLGPAGTNTLLFTPEVTTPIVPSKDGFEILNILSYDNPIHKCIYRMIVDVSTTLNTNVGDATTSSVVIAAKLYETLKNKFEKFVKTDKLITPLGFKTILNVISSNIKSYLSKSKYTTHLSDILSEYHYTVYKNVATISANNDQVIGKLVADLFNNSDTSPFIYPEIGDTTDDDVATTVGFEFASGINNPVMATEPDCTTMKYKNPYFLLVDGPLTDSDFPSLKKIISWCWSVKRRPVIFIASDFTAGINELFVINKVRGIEIANSNGDKTNQYIGIGGICLSTNNDSGKRRLKDLEVSLGATIVQTKNSRLVDLSFTNSDAGFNKVLGSADEIISVPYNTRILNGHGDKKEITSRIEKLEEELKQKLDLNENLPEYIIDSYRKRIAMMNSSMIKIYVGGLSYKEKTHRKLLFEDAIRAVKSTEKHGYMLGGNISVGHIIETKRNKIVDDVIQEISDKYKIISSNTSLETGNKIRIAISDLLVGIKTSFLLAYTIALQNVFGDTNHVNDIIDTIISGKEPTTYNALTDKYDTLDSISQLQFNDHPEIPELIVPGNTDKEIINSTFTLVSLLLTTDKLMTWMPVRGNLVK